MLRRIFLVVMAAVVSYSLTVGPGYILYTIAEGRSEAQMSLMARFIFSPVIAMLVGMLVGLLSKDHPALTSIVGFAPWALALHGPAGGGPLCGTLSWVGPTLAYVSLAACSAVLAWRLRHGREAGKNAKISVGVTHS